MQKTMIKSVKAFGRNSEIYKRTDVEAKSETLELQLRLRFARLTNIQLMLLQLKWTSTGQKPANERECFHLPGNPLITGYGYSRKHLYTLSWNQKLQPRVKTL